MQEKEILKILKDKNINEELFKQANELRHKELGNKVHLRALIEFSNFCNKNCIYCGINCKNKAAQRYRLEEDEIINTAKKGIELGFKTIVLQSGEDLYFNEKKMCSIIEKIKDLDVAITLGVGEKTKQEYQAYKNAGADRFLLRIETTDENLYKYLHPDGNLENRKKCLYNLKELSFETGTGIMIGLPNQTLESIAKDIMFFKELNADMIGLGPFVSHNDTVLKGQENGDFELSLKVLSLVRLNMPKINLPATTALETLFEHGRLKALQAGANVVMPNITPSLNKSKYSIYPNKAGIDAYDKKGLEKLYKEIESIGDTVSKGYGTSRNFTPI